MSAYIPTNLISITDGQIYLEPKMFHAGQKPAVDVGKSVSRVGGKTQPPAMRKLAESLRLEYAQFLELEIFTRFGGMVDDRTRRTIDHGGRIRAILNQPQFEPLALGLQAALLLALDERLLEAIPIDRIAAFRTLASKVLPERCAPVLAHIESTKDLSDDDRAALLAALRDVVSQVPDEPGEQAAEAR
jgi:F-type H+-transporting ATPase subunit alpha